MSATEDLERWQRKQAHYQDAGIVAEYDARRFSGVLASRSTRRKWNAVRRALGAEFDACTSFLDLPCGTGRLAAMLERAGKRFVESDLSAEMLGAASRAANGARGFLGAVRSDALHLPFADASFDVVLSIRFLFHVPRELRPEILREMARVARRYVVVDVRHKYAWSAWTKRLRARFTGKRVPYRASLAELAADFAAAGLAIERRAWLRPPFSDKLVIAARAATGNAAGTRATRR